MLNGLFGGDLDAVRSAATEAARLSREAGDLYTLGVSLTNLGLVALIAGDLDESKPLLAEALRIGGRIDDRVALYYLLDALGYHAASSGQPRLAAQVLGAAETMRVGAGARVIPTLAPLIAQAEESAIAALGRPKFEAEFKVGKRLSRGAAIGLALGEPVHVAGPAADGAGAGLLGKGKQRLHGSSPTA